MVRKKRRSKKKSSNKLLKTVILLVLFIGLWFIYNHTDIPARIRNILRPHRSDTSTVETVPEPGAIPTGTKSVSYTIRKTRNTII